MAVYWPSWMHMRTIPTQAQHNRLGLKELGKSIQHPSTTLGRITLLLVRSMLTGYMPCDRQFMMIFHLFGNCFHWHVGNWIAHCFFVCPMWFEVCLQCDNFFYCQKHTWDTLTLCIVFAVCLSTCQINGITWDDDRLCDNYGTSTERPSSIRRVTPSSASLDPLLLLRLMTTQSLKHILHQTRTFKSTEIDASR